MITMFARGSYIDPFDVLDPPAKLVNFATGSAAPPDVQASMLGAIDTGCKLLDKFVAERLVVSTDARKKSFYDTLPRSLLKTMTEMKKPLRVNNKDITMDPEVTYLRLLAVNCKKKVPLSRVLMYENTSVPPSIFTDQGLMVSCAKSDFMHKLEELVPGEKIVKITACDAVIFDGHAVIQKLPPPTSSTTNVTFKKWRQVS